MREIAYIILPLALLAVAFVLGRGLISFTRDGEEHRRRSNRLMQWRVALQFLAVILLLLFLVLAGAR